MLKLSQKTYSEKEIKSIAESVLKEEKVLELIASKVTAELLEPIKKEFAFYGSASSDTSDSFVFNNSKKLIILGFNCTFIGNKEINVSLKYMSENGETSLYSSNNIIGYFNIIEVSKNINYWWEVDFIPETPTANRIQGELVYLII